MEKKNSKLIQKFDDLINEKEVIEKFHLSKSSLQKMRREGTIKQWGTINGRRIMYSKTELITLLGFDRVA